MKPQIEELLLQFDDIYATMVTRIWRPEKSRGSVFCIHGFEGNGSDFDYLAAHLVQQGFTVVCPDMIGRGKSTYFNEKSRYNIDVYLTCLGALSKFAGQKDYFIGSSWGGALAMFFLAATKIKVEKLILNDVGLRAGAVIDGAVDFLRRDSSQEFSSLEDAYSYVRGSRGYLGEFPEELWPNYLANKVRYVDGKYRLAYDPLAMPDIKNRQYDLFPLLAKIQTKILLLYGEKSRVYDSAAVADLQKKRPDISCIANIRAGHPPSLMTYEQALLVSGYLSS
jgi:pimeloyl-ACP methyl ester carboxylesterase